MTKTSTNRPGSASSRGASDDAGAGTTVAGPRRPAWVEVQPWISMAVRLVLAGVALWAGVAKVTDLPGSVRAVRAYDLLPAGPAEVVGYALPVVEIIVGLLLLVGLLTRYVAVVNGLLMLGFVIGVASAWARGLSIDCGCFGGGGEVAEGEAEYLTVLLRDAALVAGSAFLVRWPRSRFSADGALGLDP